MGGLEWIGGLCVVSACAGLGFFKAARLQRRVGALRGLQAGLQVLDTEIAYAATPLPDAFRRIGNTFSSPAATLFAEVAEQLAGRPETGAPDLWETAVRRLAADMALEPPDVEVLLQFGRTLGASDRADQRKHIRVACDRLRVQEEAARQEAATRARMWRSLGVLIGAAIVVLLM